MTRSSRKEWPVRGSECETSQLSRRVKRSSTIKWPAGPARGRVKVRFCGRSTGQDPPQLVRNACLPIRYLFALTMYKEVGPVAHSSPVGQFYRWTKSSRRAFSRLAHSLVPPPSPLIPTSPLRPARATHHHSGPHAGCPAFHPFRNVGTPLPHPSKAKAPLSRAGLRNANKEPVR
jgi:hypothetical protein